MKKKALVFVPHRPYPPQTGTHQSELMVLEALRNLGYGVSVFGSTLATDLPWEQSSTDYLQKKLGIRAHLYQHDLIDSLFLTRQSIAHPDSWDKYNPPWFLDAFRDLFHRIKPDLVVNEYAWWGKLAIGDEFKAALRMIISYDSLTLNEKMQRALIPYLGCPLDPHHVNPIILKEDFFADLQLESTIAGAQEYQIYDQYDGTIAFSAYDEQMIRRHTSQTWVHRIPITYPVAAVRNTYSRAPLLVISNYSLNIQAYAYFAAKVLPSVLQQLPDFNLCVVGKACEKVLPVKGIELLGYVPDIKPLYREARFAICPLIGGTGMQVKILEAMAHGIPVIALKNIAHSSPIQHGLNGLIAQNAEEFAEHTIRLSRDPGLCHRLGEAARETIREEYSPAIHAQKWEEAIAAAQANRLRLLEASPNSLVAASTQPPDQPPPTVSHAAETPGLPLNPDDSPAALQQQEDRPDAELPALVHANAQTAYAESNTDLSEQSVRLNWQPKISVITPAFNCAAYLRDCIESVLSQGYPNFEHIIVDGNSQDGTINILKSYPHLKWISEPDRGEADALNKALLLATGDIIGWLNADDFYVPGALNAAAAQIDPSAGRHAVYGKVVLLGEQDHPIGVRVPTPDLSLPTLLRWHRVLHVFQPAIFYSAELVRTVGPYREDLKYAIDLDYWIRVAAAGYAFHYLDQVLARMRLVRAEGKTATPYHVKDQDWLQACLPVVTTLRQPEQTAFWKDYYYHRLLNGRLYGDAPLPPPADGAAATGLALALNDAQAFPQLVEVVPELVRQHPNQLDLYWTWGEALNHLGRRDQARQAFARAEQRTAPIDVPRSPRPGINVIGYVSGNLGIGVIARDTVRLLRERGHPVSILDLDPGLGRAGHDRTYDRLTVARPDELPYTINLFVLPLFELADLPPALAAVLEVPSRVNAALGFWELPTLPPHARAALERFDVLIASSQLIRHAFATQVSGPLTLSAAHPLYLPAGIQPDRPRFGLPADAFILAASLELHSDIQRKNPAAVLAAFRHAFENDPRAHLMIKLNNVGPEGRHHPFVAELEQNSQADPRIHLVTDTLSYTDVLSLYASCDVFVSLHRAEGLGLGLMEAMALGKPVIATAWSGNMTFMDHTNAGLVRHRLVPVEGSIRAYSRALLGEHAVWAEPDVADAANWMRRLADDPGLRQQLGTQAAADMRRWQAVARQGRWVDELLAIGEQRVGLAGKVAPVANPPVLQRATAAAGQADVVIPIYGQPELARRCVESTLATTSDAHFILVDDCSPDRGIAELFAEWKDHPRLTLARTPANGGFIGACRFGAALGQAPFILFLNSDTEAIKPGWLEKLIPTEDDIAIVGAKLLYPPDLPGPLAGTIQHAGVARNADGVPYHPFLGRPADTPDANADALRAVNAVTGACLLVRRQVWDELGGWDARFGKGVYEDVDLCWAARRKGYRVLYQPAATLYHRESASKAPDGRHELNAHTRDNLEKLLAKWRPLASDEDLFFGEKTARRWERARKHIQRAKAALNQRNTPVALAATRKAITTAPDLPEALIGYAQLLSAQGDHTGAADHFEKAIRLAPSSWDTRLRLVDEWIAAGAPERAAAELIALEAVFPQAAEVKQRAATLAPFALFAPRSAPEETPQPESPAPPRAAQTLQLLLDAEDLPTALQQQATRLDADFLALVRLNAETARGDGNAELAEGLDALAEYVTPNIPA